MLFFGPALFGASCVCWLAGVAIVYGTALIAANPVKK
jgi:hypothetical protein